MGIVFFTLKKDGRNILYLKTCPKRGLILHNSTGSGFCVAQWDWEWYSTTVHERGSEQARAWILTL